jgi:hypothetical protein
MTDKLKSSPDSTRVQKPEQITQVGQAKENTEYLLIQRGKNGRRLRSIWVPASMIKNSEKLSNYFF